MKFKVLNLALLIGNNLDMGEDLKFGLDFFYLVAELISQ